MRQYGFTISYVIGNIIILGVVGSTVKHVFPEQTASFLVMVLIFGWVLSMISLYTLLRRSTKR